MLGIVYGFCCLVVSLRCRGSLAWTVHCWFSTRCVIGRFRSCWLLLLSLLSDLREETFISTFSENFEFVAQRPRRCHRISLLFKCGLIEVRLLRGHGFFRKLTTETLRHFDGFYFNFHHFPFFQQALILLLNRCQLFLQLFYT